MYPLGPLNIIYIARKASQFWATLCLMYIYTICLGWNVSSEDWASTSIIIKAELLRRQMKAYVLSDSLLYRFRDRHYSRSEIERHDIHWCAHSMLNLFCFRWDHCIRAGWSVFVCLSSISLQNNSKSYRKILMKFGECKKEKRLLNFGTNPGHVLDGPEVLHLPVGQQ